MGAQNWVYLDGAILPATEAKVSVFDRGFLFGQAAYEVTAVYNGKLVDFDQHMARLAHTLTGIEIEMPPQDLKQIHLDLIDRNGLEEGLVYLQVTAGDQGPRDYYGPEHLAPSLFLFTTHKKLISETAKTGLHTISVEDTRWKRRDYKTTQLLSQTLAYRAARRAGVDTAIMHEDGFVTEAASANLWIITQSGDLITRDLSPALLPGITRGRLVDLFGADTFNVVERAFTLDELKEAAEAFTSSTGVVIAPVLSVDGIPIGTGTPGPVTRRVQASYYTYIGADLSQLDWL